MHVELCKMHFYKHAQMSLFTIKSCKIQNRPIRS